MLRITSQCLIRERQRKIQIDVPKGFLRTGLLDRSAKRAEHIVGGWQFHGRQLIEVHNSLIDF